MNPKVAIIGGRGYTGAEFLALLGKHRGMDLAFASSGSRAGQALRDVCPEWPDESSVFVEQQIDQLQDVKAHAWVLAVPNGAASKWARAIQIAHPDAVILDLSADHRFDAAWVYGLPERNREQIKSARHIANPGCYATAAQLALLPLEGRLTADPVIFGVSGYSGAGRTPSERNDPVRLAENLLPYALTGHVHEQEISAQLGRPVRFMPHVADFFRGISLTLSLELEDPVEPAEMMKIYSDHYADEPFVEVAAEPPEVSQVRHRPVGRVGGFACDARDPRRVALVSVVDNLSKGAAGQAMQNLNLALGLPECEGLLP